MRSVLDKIFSNVLDKMLSQKSLLASVGFQCTIRRRMKIVANKNFGSSSNLTLLLVLRLDQYDRFMKPTVYFLIIHLISEKLADCKI